MWAVSTGMLQEAKRRGVGGHGHLAWLGSALPLKDMLHESTRACWNILDVIHLTYIVDFSTFCAWDIISQCGEDRRPQPWQVHRRDSNHWLSISRLALIALRQKSVRKQKVWKESTHELAAMPLLHSAVCEIFMSYKSYKQEQVQPVECFMTLQGIRFPTSMGWHSPEFTSLFNFSYMQVCCGSLNDGLFSERYTSRQQHEKPEQAGCHASFHCNYFRLHYRDKNHNQEHQNHRPMSIWFCSKFVTGLQHGRSSNGNLCPLVEMSGVFWRELSDRLGTRESTFLGTGRHPIKAIVPLILGNVPGTPLWATFSVVRIVRFAAVTLMLPVWWNSSLSYEGFWRVLPLTGFCGRGCFCCYPLLGCCWRSWSGWWWWWWWWFVISCRDFATALYVY